MNRPFERDRTKRHRKPPHEILFNSSTPGNEAKLDGIGIHKNSLSFEIKNVFLLGVFFREVSSGHASNLD